MNVFFPEAYTAYDAPFAENNLTTTEHPPRLRPLSAPPPQYPESANSREWGGQEGSKNPNRGEGG